MAAPPPGHSSAGAVQPGFGSLAGANQPPAPEPAAPALRRTTRYYGRAAIDASRPARELEIIINEVIGQLTQFSDAEVSITLELQAWRSQGFDDATIRTVSENSRTLKFEDFGFEEE